MKKYDLLMKFADEFQRLMALGVSREEAVLIIEYIYRVGERDGYVSANKDFNEQLTKEEVA